jgi:hypothetical protein
VVLGPLLAAIGWVRSSFFPHARHGRNRCRSPSSVGPAGRGGAVRRAASRAGAATPRRVASAPADANTCSRTRSPSGGATSATGSRSATRREYRSESRGQVLACARAGGPVGRAASGSGVRAAPRWHHRRGPEAWPTVPSRASRYKRGVREF